MGTAIAAESPAAAQSSDSAAASAPPPAPATYNLHFHGVTGDPQDIANAVREALEKIERERRGRGFADD